MPEISVDSIRPLLVPTAEPLEVRNVGNATLYYKSDDTVSVSSHDGSLAANSSVVLSASAWFLSAAPGGELELVAANGAVGVSLEKAQNLKDLPSASTARTNLGLGTAATQASSAFDASGAAASAQIAAEAAATADTKTERERAETAEALKAPLASPALTGNPTAPTQAEADSSTKLATTAFAHGVAAAAQAAAESKGTSTAARIVQVPEGGSEFGVAIVGPPLKIAGYYIVVESNEVELHLIHGSEEVSGSKQTIKASEATIGSPKHISLSYTPATWGEIQIVAKSKGGSPFINLTLVME